jgi:hypothetical protein
MTPGVTHVNTGAMAFAPQAANPRNRGDIMLSYQRALIVGITGLIGVGLAGAADAQVELRFAHGQAS